MVWQEKENGFLNEAKHTFFQGKSVTREKITVVECFRLMKVVQLVNEHFANINGERIIKFYNKKDFFFRSAFLLFCFCYFFFFFLILFGLYKMIAQL